MRLLVLALAATALLLAPAPVASAQACVLADLGDDALVQHAQCQAARAECFARAALDPQGACTL